MVLYPIPNSEAILVILMLLIFLKYLICFPIDVSLFISSILKLVTFPKSHILFDFVF